MDKDTKRNIIIAAVLSVAAVFVFYWMKPSAVYSADPNSVPVPDTSGAASPAATPGYMSYNVPPYDPGALPPITYNSAQGGNVTNNGKGCCPGCAGADIGITSSIGHYYGLMGMGSVGAAA